METIGHLNIFLDRVFVGCAADGFSFDLAAPAGRFPVVVQRRDGVIGRATVILDPKNAEESFREELFEPLYDIWIESNELVVAGAAAREIWGPSMGAGEIEGTSLEVDETGANVIKIELPYPGRTVEVAWWYGGDDEAAHEGIVALDLIWDHELDPVGPDSPVRNMESIIQNFFNEHGPPSLRTEES